MGRVSDWLQSYYESNNGDIPRVFTVERDVMSMILLDAGADQNVDSIVFPVQEGPTASASFIRSMLRRDNDLLRITPIEFRTGYPVSGVNLNMNAVMRHLLDSPTQPPHTAEISAAQRVARHRRWGRSPTTHIDNSIRGMIDSIRDQIYGRSARDTGPNGVQEFRYVGEPPIVVVDEPMPENIIERVRERFARQTIAPESVIVTPQQFDSLHDLVMRDSQGGNNWAGAHIEAPRVRREDEHARSDTLSDEDIRAIDSAQRAGHRQLEGDAFERVDEPRAGRTYVGDVASGEWTLYNPAQHAFSSTIRVTSIE